MKRWIAVLLIIGLVLGSMTTAAFAKKPGSTSKAVPQYSTYEFDYDLPDYILADKDTEVEVTFQTKVEGIKGYDDVLFNIDSECIRTEDGDDNGQVTFTAKDSNGKAVIIVNGGTWGPANGFDLPADYKATTDWKINFSKAGKYIISFGLIDKDGDIINEIEESITVKVVDGVFIFEAPEKVVENKATDIAVTFETEQNYDNNTRLEFEVKGPGKADFEEIDTNNWTLTKDGGYWDAHIDDSYNEKTEWEVTFDEEGLYTIIFRLIDEDKDEILIQDNLKISVLEDEETEEDDDDKDGDKNNGKKNGNTHGLLNALNKHLSKGKVNGGTLRLMELLESRGVDVEKAIEEIQEAIENGLAGTREDYETLGKLYKEKHREREVFINGKRAEFDVSPILQDGRTLLPFRQIAEALGAEVEWDGEEQKVTVTKDKDVVELYLNQKFAKVNGKKVELDVPAQIYKDRTIIPIRFLAESLDTNVDFYPEGSLIVIMNK